MTVPAEIAASKQISLTTYRKDGTPVATPVWHVSDGGTLTVLSAADAGKVKRLRRNPAVEVVACDVRGTVRPGAQRLRGTAVVLPPEETERVRRLMEGRYVSSRLGSWFVRTLHLRRPAAIGIVITV